MGVGEKIVDLEQFYPERAASRILGMGDVVSLVEKVESAISLREQESAQQSFAKGRMTLQDFAQQLEIMGKLGSLSQLMNYLPGGAAKMSPNDLERGEKELVKFKAIISSMTLKERLDHRLLNGSRKQRIARGAGVDVTDVNVLLDRFEQSQQYVKLFKKFNRFSKFLS